MRDTNLLAIQQRILVLHAHKLRPPVLLRDRVQQRKLPSPHRARADVAHFPGLDEVVERLHRLFGRRRGVGAVDLVEVDVRLRGIEALERALDRVENRRA